MENEHPTFGIGTSMVHLVEGDLYTTPIPTTTVGRWKMAKILTQMATEAARQAVCDHNPAEIVCPVCKVGGFRGTIDDGYGNTIPCWRCNLESAEWDRRITDVATRLNQSQGVRVDDFPRFSHD